MTEIISTYDKVRVLDAVCRTDFASFVRKCFYTLAPNGEYLMNWHILAMAYHLELVRQGKLKRLIINLPPRYLKTLVATVAFPAFVLGHDPSKRIISVTYGSEPAIKSGNDFRSITTALWYQRVFPGMRTAGKNTESEVTTTQHGYRLASSIEGPLTGRGGDVIIVDDAHKASDALSASRRTMVKDVFYNTVYSRLDDKRGGAIIMLGQRLHIDDLVGTLLRSPEEWTVLSLPAIAEEDEIIQIGEDDYHYRRSGEVLHPERDPIETLESTRHLIGLDNFAAQYQQAPVPPGGVMIRREWIKRFERLPEPVSLCEVVQSWDTASSDGERSDWSVCTTWMIDRNNHYYLIDVQRGHWDYPTLEDQAIATARKHRPNRILIENTGIGPALIAKLNALRFLAIGITPEGNKQDRMSIQSAKFRDGRVLLPRNAPWLSECENELCSFPNGRHDDQVDSISQALRHERRAAQWSQGANVGLENFYRGLGAQMRVSSNRNSFEAMGIGGVQAYLLGLSR